MIEKVIDEKLREHYKSQNQRTVEATSQMETLQLTLEAQHYHKNGSLV
jgi:hypothetical protein